MPDLKKRRKTTKTTGNMLSNWKQEQTQKILKADEELNS
jgi:hypothetical protein